MAKTPEADDSNPAGLGDTFDGDGNLTLYLAQKAKRGDSEALGELFEMHLPWLRRQVSHRIKPSLRVVLETMDALHDGFPAVARQIQKLDIRDERSIRNWLLTIALGALNDRRKGIEADKRTPQGRQIPALGLQGDTDDSKVGLELPHQTAGPLTRASSGELQEIVREEIERLPADQQRILDLRDAEGLSWDEVRERIDAPTAGAARVRYERAWKRVRDSVVDRTGEDSDA